MASARPARPLCALAQTTAVAAVGLSLSLFASGCATPAGPQRAERTATPAVAAPVQGRDAPVAEAADALLSGLSRLCGQAFAGQIEVDTPPPATSAFAGKPLVMHVRECGRDAAGVPAVRVPFHVGDDRSRTWVFTRTGAGLRLKHDHRHADGAPDAITLYGGDADKARVGGVPGWRLEFPVDAESVAMFGARGLTASLRNTWAVELSDTRFVYELARPDGRLFRVVFDLTRPVSVPPAPWGASTEG